MKVLYNEKAGMSTDIPGHSCKNQHKIIEYKYAFINNSGLNILFRKNSDMSVW